MPTLQQRWETTVSLLSVDIYHAAEAQVLLGQLLTAYSEPHRHYHTLQHLEECFTHLDALRFIAADPIAIELALWFHDSIYDSVDPTDNEERSAKWAVQALTSLGVSTKMTQRVYDLIMITKAHTPPDGDIDAATLVDCDLGILAAASDRYHEYAGQIRQEYEHFSDLDFAEGRTKVLEGLSSKARIYRTKLMISECEDRARVNMADEIERLKALGR